MELILIVLFISTIIAFFYSFNYYFMWKEAKAENEKTLQQLHGFMGNYITKGNMTAHFNIPIAIDQQKAVDNLILELQLHSVQFKFFMATSTILDLVIKHKFVKSTTKEILPLLREVLGVTAFDSHTDEILVKFIKAVHV